MVYIQVGDSPDGNEAGAVGGPPAVEDGGCRARSISSRIRARMPSSFVPASLWCPVAAGVKAAGPRPSVARDERKQNA